MLNLPKNRMGRFLLLMTASLLCLCGAIYVLFFM